VRPYTRWDLLLKWRASVRAREPTLFINRSIVYAESCVLFPRLTFTLNPPTHQYGAPPPQTPTEKHPTLSL